MPHSTPHSTIPTPVPSRLPSPQPLLTHKDERPVLAGQGHNVGQRGHMAVHGEDAVRGNEAHARAARLLRSRPPGAGAGGKGCLWAVQGCRLRPGAGQGCGGSACQAEMEMGALTRMRKPPRLGAHVPAGLRETLPCPQAMLQRPTWPHATQMCRAVRCSCRRHRLHWLYTYCAAFGAHASSAVHYGAV